MKKAQNVIEMVLLGAMVVVVTIALFTLYNNQKTKLVENSKVKTTDVAGLLANNSSNPFGTGGVASNDNPTTPETRSGGDSSGSSGDNPLSGDVQASLPKTRADSGNTIIVAKPYDEAKFAVSKQSLITLAAATGTIIPTTITEQQMIDTMTQLYDYIKGMSDSQKTAAQKAFEAAFKDILK